MAPRPELPADSPLLSWWREEQDEEYRLRPDKFYVDRYDELSGRWWKQDITKMSSRRIWFDSDYKHVEAGLSVEQYELVGWALWKFDEGWSLEEIFSIIDRFWPQWPGQTPLTPLSITAWNARRAHMRGLGLRWP